MVTFLEQLYLLADGLSFCSSGFVRSKLRIVNERKPQTILKF